MFIIFYNIVHPYVLNSFSIFENSIFEEDKHLKPFIPAIFHLTFVCSIQMHNIEDHESFGTSQNRKDLV